MAQISVPVLVREQIGPGEIICPQIDLSLLDGILARLDPQLVAFDDPSVRITLMLRLSRDGGITWPVVVSADIVGGSRSRDGGLPFLEQRMLRAQGFTRGEFRVVLNTQLRLGLEGTAETV